MSPRGLRHPYVRIITPGQLAYAEAFFSEDPDIHVRLGATPSASAPPPVEDITVPRMPPVSALTTSTPNVLGAGAINFGEHPSSSLPVAVAWPMFHGVTASTAAAVPSEEFGGHNTTANQVIAPIAGPAVNVAQSDLFTTQPQVIATPGAVDASAAVITGPNATNLAPRGPTANQMSTIEPSGDFMTQDAINFNNFEELYNALIRHGMVL